MMTGLASLKSIGQANSLETQAGVDSAVLRQNFFYSGKSEFFLIKPPKVWMRPTHIMEANLLYFKSAVYKC